MPKPIPPSQPAADPTALFEVSQDQGPFEHMGNVFACNGTKWAGRAIASPVAVYLMKTRRVEQGGGGLVGALVSAALHSNDGLSTCAVQDLPPAIRANLDRKGKLGTKAVVIVPRSTVFMVKNSKFNNSIQLEAGHDKFRVDTRLFSMFAIPRNMQAMGWTFNTYVKPTAAPVHDPRSPEQRAAGGNPWWVRLLYVAAAIGVFILYVALRVFVLGH